VRIFDISQTLRAGVPVWPGDTPYEEVRTWTIADGPVNVSRITLSTHTGAHADAPLHYDADGLAIGEVGLDVYLGPCRVIDARDFGPVIEAAHLPETLPPRVLFRTFEEFPHAHWPANWTVVSPGAIEALADRGVRLIGIDGPSLDPQESKSMDAHHAVRRRGLAILEGLVLDAPPPGDYELIALPLKLGAADAAPVRAVLRTLP